MEVSLIIGGMMKNQCKMMLLKEEEMERELF